MKILEVNTEQFELPTTKDIVYLHAALLAPAIDRFQEGIITSEQFMKVDDAVVKLQVGVLKQTLEESR